MPRGPRRDWLSPELRPIGRGLVGRCRRSRKRRRTGPPSRHGQRREPRGSKGVLRNGPRGAGPGAAGHPGERAAGGRAWRRLPSLAARGPRVRRAPQAWPPQGGRTDGDRGAGPRYLDPCPGAPWTFDPVPSPPADAQACTRTTSRPPLGFRSRAADLTDHLPCQSPQVPPAPVRWPQGLLVPRGAGLLGSRSPHGLCSRPQFALYPLLRSCSSGLT